MRALQIMGYQFSEGVRGRWDVVELLISLFASVLFQVTYPVYCVDDIMTLNSKLCANI
jgi:hypothetical protein